MKLRKRRPERFVSLDEDVKTEDDSLPREVADWSPNPEQLYNQEELRDIYRGRYRVCRLRSALCCTA